MNNKNRDLVMASAIAAVYALLTLLSAAFGLSAGPIQIRISEALCILPCFTQAAVPGLFIGCLLADLLTGCTPADVIFGSLATLLGALGTRALKDRPALAVLPPILSNTLIIPRVLIFSYHMEAAAGWLSLSIGLSECLSCGVLGLMLHRLIRRQGIRF